MMPAAATAGAERRAVTADRTVRRDAWAPLLLGALLGVMVAGRFETVLLGLALAACGAWALGAPRPARRWIARLAASVALALVLNLYLVGGRPLPLPRLFGAPATLEGLRFGALLALRLIGAAIALHALAALWPGERAADELAGLLAPLSKIGVPVDEARVVVGLALRFVPLVGAEAARIARLQSLRAGRPPRGLGERLVRLRARVVPALTGALERAEQVALALEARHHRARPVARPRWPAWASWAGAAFGAVALLWRG